MTIHCIDATVCASSQEPQSHSLIEANFWRLASTGLQASAINTKKNIKYATFAVFVVSWRILRHRCVCVGINGVCWPYVIRPDCVGRFPAGRQRILIRSEAPARCKQANVGALFAVVSRLEGSLRALRNAGSLVLPTEKRLGMRPTRSTSASGPSKSFALAAVAPQILARVGAQLDLFHHAQYRRDNCKVVAISSA